ncbi:MAG: hypothetical protein QOD74_2666 [Variibacter sp.]|nr:hypothetical protein [Variibacter sp.]
MAQRSAGILAYRRLGGELEVFLVHPGGPYWRRKDAGAWMIPKGEIMPGEEELTAALREFQEETGVSLEARFHPLGEVRQAGGKHVIVWAAQADIDAAVIVSMTFEMEWPPRSGRKQIFPEVDRAAWFDLARAREYVLPSQRPFLDRLEEAVNSGALSRMS